MNFDERFEVIYKESSSILSGGQKLILLDRETGVQYLFVQSGHAGGLTPLLGADGKPLVAPKE